MAYTHLQPAEPTTVGYRLAVYGQDLLEQYVEVDRLIANLRGKGLKGAVGTAASYQELLAGSAPLPASSRRFLERLSLRAFPLPRKPIRAAKITTCCAR
jgi:adenylosuccinate lyase